MRLDKFVSKAALLSRTQANTAIRKGRVSVNNTVCRIADFKVDENEDVKLDGDKLVYNEYLYIMMNKPSGVLSATEDGKGMTVIDLLDTRYSNSQLFPVGRLDKDTVGLLILTNDGPLAHKLLSPKHHVKKTYYLETEKAIAEDVPEIFKKGVYIGEGITTMPADIKVLSEKSAELTICEGKFHQIKRMLEAVDNKVVFLERVKFGNIELDRSLSRGEYRILDEKEITEIKNAAR